MTTAARQKQQARKDSRFEQLFDAAAACFCDMGFDGASMRDIARLADMKAGSMYYHFDSKAELFIAVHEEGIRRITDRVQAAVASKTDPWERLEAAVVAHLVALLEEGNYAKVVVREPPVGDAEMRSRLVTFRDRYESMFRGLIEDLALPPGVSRKYLRMLLLGALNWSQTWYRPGEEPPEEIAREFINLIKRKLD